MGPRSRLPRTRAARSGLLALLCAGGFATVATAVLPMGSTSSELRASIETAVAFSSILAAALLAIRYRRTGRLEDAVPAAALLSVALTNVAFGLLPVLDPSFGGELTTRALVAGRLTGAAFLALGAFLPDRIARPGHTGTPLLLALAVPAVSLWVAAAAPALGFGWGHDALGLEAGGLLFMALAAIGFSRRARGGDELALWFAVACGVFFVGRLASVVDPSSVPGEVTSRDAMRLTANALLFAGAVRQISLFARDAARLELSEARRALARELHDGLAQDLAFIAMAAPRLDGPAELSDRVATAARRALGESRGVVDALADSRRAAPSLCGAVQELAERHGVEVVTEIPDEGLGPRDAHELSRIAAEAVANAARHGGAGTVWVSLAERAGRRVLRVRDDGRGLAAVPAQGGFGLRSMTERARLLGGEFALRAHPAGGCEVEVVFG